MSGLLLLLFYVFLTDTWSAGQIQTRPKREYNWLIRYIGLYVRKWYIISFTKFLIMKNFVLFLFSVGLFALVSLPVFGIRSASNAQEPPPPALERFWRDRDKPHKDDEIIVSFVPDTSPKAVHELARRYGARIKRHNQRLGTYLLRLEQGTADDVLPLLLSEPQVAWAELNFLVTGELTPLDPDYADPNKTYGPQIIRAPEGWDITTGSPGIVVAVVDSGISPTHAEFAGRLLPGYDFVNEDNNPADDHGHGTHVAGIVAAAMNNGLGSTGIAPNVSLLPVKVLNASNVGTWADIADGITYAADQGAHIINLSLGGPVYSQTLENAVVYAAGRGAIIVAAAGNAFSSNPFYPAYFPETVAVVATDAFDILWPYSNFGDAVDVAAPGVNIWSTLWSATAGDTFGFMTGTSMAAPHVSGLAALALAVRPDLSRADVQALIQRTALDLGAAGWDPYYGFGRIDVAAALMQASVWSAADRNPTPTFTPTPTATPTATPTPTPTPTPYVQRVNAGGPVYTDTMGRIWAADQAWAAGSWGYVGSTSAKSATKNAVSHTDDDPLYQRYREGSIEYRFTVPNGSYDVRLRWAEMVATAAGQRVMSVSIEGIVAEPSLDVFVRAGGRYLAWDGLYTDIPVSDGVLNIVLSKVGGRYNPMIAGIEVLGAEFGSAIDPLPTHTPTPTPTATPRPPAPDRYRVNAGGVSYRDGLGQVWTADQLYTTGSGWGATGGSAKSTSTAVAGTDDDILFQTWRDNPGSYLFSVPNGNYRVTLRFAEFEVTKAGERVMRISIEGVTHENQLDLYALVGRATALERTYQTTVADGLLQIDFVKNGGRRSPIVAAIAIEPLP